MVWGKIQLLQQILQLGFHVHFSDVVSLEWTLIYVGTTHVPDFIHTCGIKMYIRDASCHIYDPDVIWKTRWFSFLGPSKTNLMSQTSGFGSLKAIFIVSDDVLMHPLAGCGVLATRQALLQGNLQQAPCRCSFYVRDVDDIYRSS